MYLVDVGYFYGFILFSPEKYSKTSYLFAFFNYFCF